MQPLKLNACLPVTKKALSITRYNIINVLRHIDLQMLNALSERTKYTNIDV